LKSLHILHSEAATGWGGQEIRIFQEIVHLLKRGHRVSLLCQPGSPLAERGKSLDHAEFTLRPFQMKRVFDVPAFLSLRKIFKQCRPDIVHTHSSIDSWLFGLTARSLRIPVIRSRHISIPVRKFIPNSWLYSKIPQAIITSGQAIRQQMIDVPGVAAEKVGSIAAGVDLERFDVKVSGENIRLQLGVADDCPLIGKIGVIRGWKGYDYFLQAIPFVLEKYPQAQFVIVGTGPGYEEIKGKAEAMQLGKAIHVLGHREDVPEILAALDVLALASFAGEGTPQVIPQAFAMKTPVVATRVGSTPELLQAEKLGILAEPKNGKSLADGILRLLDDKSLAEEIADNAYQHCLKEMTIDRMIDQNLAVYQSVLPNP
jgi:glycosyltransferase involved in cell wall biosynthesis